MSIRPILHRGEMVVSEPRVKDLYLHVDSDKHIGTNNHREIVTAHNSLVEMVMSLRKRVKELEHAVEG